MLMQFTRILKLVNLICKYFDSKRMKCEIEIKSYIGRSRETKTYKRERKLYSILA